MTKEPDEWTKHALNSSVQIQQCDSVGDGDDDNDGVTFLVTSQEKQWKMMIKRKKI